MLGNQIIQLFASQLKTIEPTRKIVSDVKEGVVLGNAKIAKIIPISAKLVPFNNQGLCLEKHKP